MDSIHMCTEKLRGLEVVLFVVLLSLSWDSLNPPKHNITPEPVQISLLGVVYDVNNPDFSNPITVGDRKCYQADILACPDSATACCGTSYFQTVSDTNLSIISFLVPVLVLMLRWLVSKFVLQQDSNGHAGALAGWLCSQFITNLWTQCIKYFVGYPRPNYYALKAFYDYNHFSDDNASLSFPSGHSSLSMCSMFFITLLMLQDASKISATFFSNTDRTGSFLARSVLQLLALLATCLSLWVGATRIRDFFHFPIDVTCGWIIGASSAYFGFAFVMPSLSEGTFTSHTDGERSEPMLP